MNLPGHLFLLSLNFFQLFQSRPVVHRAQLLFQTPFLRSTTLLHNRCYLQAVVRAANLGPLCLAAIAENANQSLFVCAPALDGLAHSLGIGIRVKVLSRRNGGLPVLPAISGDDGMV